MKKYTALIVMTVILGIYTSSLSPKGDRQHLIFAKPVTANITLTGQIIPAVNTGSDAGVESYGMPDNEVWQPMEYHLYDRQGKDVKLSFDDESLDLKIWQKWLDENPQKEQIQTEIAQNPRLWSNYPKYITYSYVWQRLTGQWVALSGQFTSTGVFEVVTIEQVNQPTQQVSTTNTTAVDASASPKTHQVTFTGQIVVAQNNPGPLPTGKGHIGGFRFRVTDTTGKARLVYVYHDQPNCKTRITFGSDPVQSDLPDFLDFRNQWAQFTGWVLYPPRSASDVGTVELQFVQVLAPATPTSTPVIN